MFCQLSAPRKIASEEYLVLGDDEEAHWEVTENFFLCFFPFVGIFTPYYNNHLFFTKLEGLLLQLFDLPLLICMKLCSCWFFYHCFARVKSQIRVSFDHKKVCQFKLENSFSVRNEKNSKYCWKTSSTMLRPFSYFELMVISWNFRTRCSDKNRRSYLSQSKLSYMYCLCFSFQLANWPFVI